MEKGKTRKVEGIIDVFLAAYLQSHNFELVGTQRGLFCPEFCFESTSKLDKAISDYLGKKDKIPALSLAEHYRVLKAMILERGNDHDRA